MDKSAAKASHSIITILGGSVAAAEPTSEVADDNLNALQAHASGAVDRIRAEQGAPVKSESLFDSED